MLINLFNNKSYFQKAKQNNRDGEIKPLTWEVPSVCHPPVCRRVEAMVVTWSQINYTVKQLIPLRSDQGILECARVILI